MGNNGNGAQNIYIKRNFILMNVLEIAKKCKLEYFIHFHLKISAEDVFQFLNNITLNTIKTFLTMSQPN